MAEKPKNRIKNGACEKCVEEGKFFSTLWVWLTSINGSEYKRYLCRKHRADVLINTPSSKRSPAHNKQIARSRRA